MTSTLIPIKKTRFNHRIIGNDPTHLTPHKECWAAVSEDGIWAFERIEEPGTPWITTHVPSGRVMDRSGNLTKARKYVTFYAEADLERLEAHERGEHGQGRWVLTTSDEGRAHAPFASIRYGADRSPYGYIAPAERDPRCRWC